MADISKSADDDTAFALADIADINTAWNNGTDDIRERYLPREKSEVFHPMRAPEDDRV